MERTEKVNKKICPKCKSTNVSYKPNPFEVMGGNLMQYHKCNDCGLEGIMPELVKKAGGKKKK